MINDRYRPRCCQSSRPPSQFLEVAGTRIYSLTAEYIIKLIFIFDGIFPEHKTLNNPGWYALPSVSFTNAAYYANTFAVALFLASQVIIRFVNHFAPESWGSALGSGLLCYSRASPYWKFLGSIVNILVVVLQAEWRPDNKECWSNQEDHRAKEPQTRRVWECVWLFGCAPLPADLWDFLQERYQRRLFTQTKLPSDLTVCPPSSANESPIPTKISQTSGVWSQLYRLSAKP